MRAKKTSRRGQRKPEAHANSKGFIELDPPGDTYQRIGPDHPWHPEAMANNRARRARRGDVKQAREVLEAFIAAIEQHTERTWADCCSGMTYLAYAQFIADALRKVLNEPDADARVALGLKISTAGRRAGTARRFDYEAVSAARELLRAYGFTAKQAAGHLVGAIPGVTPEIIRNATAEHPVHATFRCMAKGEDRDGMLEILKQLAEPFSASIKSILASRRTRNPS